MGHTRRPALQSPSVAPRASTPAGPQAGDQSTLGNAALAASLPGAEADAGSSLLSDDVGSAVAQSGPPPGSPPAPPARPKALSAGKAATVLDDLDPELAVELLKGGNITLWENSLGSPEAVTAELVQSGDGKMGDDGAMTLDPLTADVATGPTTADALGESIASRMPVTRITAERRGQNVVVSAQVNPSTLVLIILAAAFLWVVVKLIQEYRDRYVDVPGALLPPGAAALGELPPLPPDHAYRPPTAAGTQAARRASTPHQGLGFATFGAGPALSAHSHVADPLAPSGRRPIGAVIPTAAPVAGARQYPMASAAFNTPGENFDRGHVRDHAHRAPGSNLAPDNYVPETAAFNQGPHSHEMTRLRHAGGGREVLRYQYGAAPQRTTDQTPVPDRINFRTHAAATGNEAEWDVPNNQAAYGNSRSAANGAPFRVPPGAMGRPPVVEDRTLQQLMLLLCALGIVGVGFFWDRFQE